MTVLHVVDTWLPCAIERQIDPCPQDGPIRNCCKFSETACQKGEGLDFADLPTCLFLVDVVLTVMSVVSSLANNMNMKNLPGYIIVKYTAHRKCSPVKEAHIPFSTSTRPLGMHPV